jgi:high-affinity Fe2+/Pb2+ permease
VAFQLSQRSGIELGDELLTITPLSYAYLAGSAILFAVWLVFFFLRRDLRKEMLTMSVLIGVLSVVTGYVWWTVDWWGSRRNSAS